MKDWIAHYLAEQSKLTLSLPKDEIAAWIGILSEARRRGNKIFSCGNGGSASNSSHFAVDLGKSASGVQTRDHREPAQQNRFRVQSLNDNMAWVTALGNDLSYEDIFVEQLKNDARPGDVLIAISVSGNSPNVVKAVQWGRAEGLTTLALVGNRTESALKQYADRALVVPDQHYGRVEDAQMHVLHLLCYAFIEGKAGV